MGRIKIFKERVLKSVGRILQGIVFGVRRTARGFKRMILRGKPAYRRRLYWLMAGVVIVVVLPSYFLLSLLAVSSARLELLSLKQEINEGNPCHEACRLRRQEQGRKVAAALISDRRLRKDLEVYFLEAAAQPFLPSAQELRRELISIIKSAYGTEASPEFLADYLIDSSGNGLVKAEIINGFLVTLTDPLWLDYYLAILGSGEDEEAKEAAIRGLSNFPDKTVAALAINPYFLQDLIISSALAPGLKLDILFLLLDYQEIFPEDVLAVLASIYNSEADPVLKTLAAEGLQREGVYANETLTLYEALPLSDDDLQKYFN